ncbi:MAG: hypothetical protein V3V61_05555 [Gammaproteobacteria bacterium]
MQELDDHTINLAKIINGSLPPGATQKSLKNDVLLLLKGASTIKYLNHHQFSYGTEEYRKLFAGILRCIKERSSQPSINSLDGSVIKRIASQITKEDCEDISRKRCFQSRDEEGHVVVNHRGFRVTGENAKLDGPDGRPKDKAVDEIIEFCQAVKKGQVWRTMKRRHDDVESDESDTGLSKRRRLKEKSLEEKGIALGLVKTGTKRIMIL